MNYYIISRTVYLEPPFEDDEFPYPDLIGGKG